MNITGNRLAIIVAAVAAALVWTAPASGAPTASYHPNAEVRSFATSAGGWTEASDQGGLLCIPPVTCPTIANTFVGAGGAGGPGDGFLETEVSGLATLLATSTGTWTSPPFTYNGVAGTKPTSLVFRSDQRADIGDLLALPGASVSQTVELVDTSAGNETVTLIEGPLGADASWQPVDPVALGAGQLTLGHTYRIRIATTFDTPIGVLPDSAVGYDNVRLIARGVDAKANRKFARQFKRAVGPAVLSGPHLYLRVKCPRSAHPHNCAIRARAALTKRGKAVTKRKQVRAAPGAKGYIKLKIRPRFRRTLATRKAVFAKVRVKAGARRASFTKRVPLKR